MNNLTIAITAFATGRRQTRRRYPFALPAASFANNLHSEQIRAATMSADKATSMHSNIMALDQAALNQLRALDPDGSSGLLAQIIASYLIDTPNLIRQMQAALAENDMVSLTRHAHSLKSTSLSVGATRVGQIASDVEIAGRSKALESCRSLLGALTAEYAVAAHLLQAECDALKRPS